MRTALHIITVILVLPVAVFVAPLILIYIKQQEKAMEGY